MSGGDEYAALILVCITVGDLSPLGVLTARDIIWLSAAARLREEHEKQLRVEEWKAKDMQFSIHARGMLDLQFLALDIDNLLRIYMGGKRPVYCDLTSCLRSGYREMTLRSGN